MTWSQHTTKHRELHWFRLVTLTSIWAFVAWGSIPQIKDFWIVLLPHEMPVDKRAISHVYFSSGSIKPFIKNGNDILNVSSTKEPFQNFTKSFFASHESHVKRPFILDRASHHSTTYYIAQHKCWMEMLQCKALSDIAYVSKHICEFIRLYLGSNTKNWCG